MIFGTPWFGKKKSVSLNIMYGIFFLLLAVVKSSWLIVSFESVVVISVVPVDPVVEESGLVEPLPSSERDVSEDK